MNSFSVVALDARGYNESDKPEGAHNYIVDKLANDVAEAIQKLNGVGRTILVGHGKSIIHF
jgi:pimeloyl-ACP methyl ester carboxylesterase